MFTKTKFASINQLDRYLILSALCIPVQGNRRSIICDLQRENYDFIPNSLYDILTNYKGRKLREIFELSGSDNESVLVEYLEFLFKNDYIFFSDTPERFPDINLDWKSPNKITNAIIDFDESSNHNFRAILSELDDLNCPAIQLRFYYSPAFTFLKKVLTQLDGTGIRTVEIIMAYSKTYTYSKAESLMRLAPRLREIRITSSPFEKSYTFNNYRPNIYFLKRVVNSSNCCGQISQSNFQVNIHLFSESLSYNSCMNRKISIDSSGIIKNCPSSNKHFGKHGEANLLNIVELKDFKSLWSINKDQIEVCKDCEFRYICTDCRALLSKPEDQFSKPLKCSYDPYTATWKNGQKI